MASKKLKEPQKVIIKAYVATAKNLYTQRTRTIHNVTSSVYSAAFFIKKGSEEHKRIKKAILGIAKDRDQAKEWASNKAGLASASAFFSQFDDAEADSIVLQPESKRPPVYAIWKGKKVVHNSTPDLITKGDQVLIQLTLKPYEKNMGLYLNAITLLEKGDYEQKDHSLDLLKEAATALGGSVENPDQESLDKMEKELADDGLDDL